MIASWRSLLFVPADQPRRLEKAHDRGADAVILDLEDAVSAQDKAAARAAAGEAVGVLAVRGVEVLVRINSALREGLADLEAVTRPGLTAVMAPKVKDAWRLVALSEALDDLEAERGLPVGSVGLTALIESPAALPRLEAIAGAPRVVALAFGGEDFSADLGAPPTFAALGQACQQVAYAAAGACVGALGVPASIGEFRDLAAWRAGLEQARAMGMTGALCIHPDQVAHANAAFTPRAEETAHAEAVLEAWEAAASGVGALDGKMIDAPVAARARRVLAARRV